MIARWGILLGVLFAGIFAMPAFARAAPLPSVSEDDLFIFQIRLGRYILSDSAIGYGGTDDVCLLLDDLLSALEFAITPTDEGVYEGWFIREQNTFALDPSVPELKIGGKTIPIAEGDLLDDMGSPCVSLKAASVWFPADISADIQNALIIVESRSPLPVEERAARKKRRAGLGGQTGDQAQTGEARVVPYNLISVPQLDVSLSAQASKDGLSVSGDAVTAGDLLGMESNFLIAADDKNGLLGIRGTLRRVDRNGVLPFAKKINRIELGDVSTLASGASAGSLAGRGIALSTSALKQGDVFDRQTFRGNLPANWEAELYHNGVLLDFQASRDDRRYEFEDVPLRFGLNRIVIKLYGPQGQVREEVREVFVDDGVLARGETRGRVTVLQENVPTFHSARLEAQPGTGSLRYQAGVDVGLSKKLTLMTEFNGYEEDGARRAFADIGLATSVLGAGVTLESSIDLEGGEALALALKKQFGFTQVGVTTERFSDFESEAVDGKGPQSLRARSSLYLSTTLFGDGWQSLPLTLEADTSSFRNDTEQVSAKLRVSKRVGPARLTNELRYQRVTRDDGAMVETASGALLANVITSGVSARVGVDYALLPEAKVSRVSLSSDFTVSEKLKTRIDVGHQVASGKTAIGLGVSGQFGPFSLGFTGRYSGEGEMSAGLTFSTSLASVPGGPPVLVGRRVTESGLALARVFLDDDGDGVLSEGEEIFDGAGASVDRRRAEGLALPGRGILLAGLGAHEPVEIGADTQSIDDPYLVIASPEPILIAPRPGRVALVDVPLVQSGEVVGMVYLRRGEERVPVGDVEMVLRRQNGTVVKAAKSEFDGFLLFDTVPYGTYTIDLEADQAARLGLAISEKVTVTVSAAQDVVEGVVIELSATPAPSV